MVSATFTGLIITHYENALSAYVALTAFIPMLMDTGGNAGSQATVTIIRSLSLGEISMRDTVKILWKEIRVAVLCGITLAVVNFAKLMLFDRVGLRVSLVVCFTLVFDVLVSRSWAPFCRSAPRRSALIRRCLQARFLQRLWMLWRCSFILRRQRKFLALPENKDRLVLIFIEGHKPACSRPYRHRRKGSMPYVEVCRHPQRVCSVFPQKASEMFFFIFHMCLPGPRATFLIAL